MRGLLGPLLLVIRLLFGPRSPPSYWPYPLQHVLIVGITGSGKTTGSLAHCLRAWLARPERPGGLFVASKRDDVKRYVAHAEAVGRGGDVIHVTPHGPWGGDPLAMFFTRPESTPLAAGRLLDQCLALHDEGATGGDENKFFRTWGSITRLHAITLCLAAHNTVRVKWVKKVIDSLPSGSDDERFETGFTYETLKKAIDRMDCLPPAFLESLCEAQQFVTRTFRAMPEKQREGVRSTAGAGLDALISYPLGQLLDRDTLHFDLLGDGKLVMLDLPPLVGGHAYRVLAALIRSAMEAALIARPYGGRPVLSVIDEYPLHFLPDDPMRAATAREGGLYMVRLVQCDEVAQISIGGHLSEQMLHAFVEQCPLLVAHAVRGKTAERIAKLCGETRTLLLSGGAGDNNYDFVSDVLGTRQPTTHTGFHEQIRDAVPAWKLGRLKRGGPPDFETECLIVEAGTWQVVTLPQIFV